MMNQTMNYKAYYTNLKTMQDPIMPSQIPKIAFDARGLLEYARKKGVEPHQLSEEEKNKFLSPTK